MATKSKLTGRESDKFMLRLPDGMRDRLRDQAAKNGRTMNAEVVAQLEHALGIGKVQRAAEGMAGTIEQLTLWHRLRTLSEQVLRMREIQHQPEEFMALVATMEQEADRVVAQTQSIDESTSEVIENISKAVASLTKAAAQAKAKQQNQRSARRTTT